jgi:hypothetical protein
MTAPQQPAGGRFGALLRDKRVLIAGGVGLTGLAAFVAVRKKKAAGAQGAYDVAAGSSLAGTPGNPASINTVGSDVAAQLGQFGASIQTQLNDYQKTLTTSLAGISVPVTPSPAPSAPTKAATPAAATAKAASSAGYITTGKYGVDPTSKTTLSGIASANKTTVSALMKLNPWITNKNVIPAYKPIRIR